MAEQQVIIDLISDSEEENEGPNASSSFSANAASGQGGGPAAAGSRPPAGAKEEKPCSSSGGGGGGRGGSSGGGASGGSVGAPLAPPHAPPTANDAAGGESGRPRPPSPPASQAAHVLSSPSGAAAAGGGEDAPPAPEELKDGLQVWVLNVNKKPQPHGVNTWPARVCEEGGRWVREVRPPPEGDRAHFARLVAKCQGGGGGGEPMRLVYLYEGRAHHYHAVPRGALRRFRHPRDPPARADALPPPGRKKLNYAVYYFCEENGLPPEEYVGDYKPPLAGEEDGGGEGEGSETDSMELRSELIKSLDALEHQIQGVTFQNFFPLVRSLNGALRCSGCLLDNMDVEQDYLSVHNLLKILEGFEKLLKFVEERTKDNNHNKMMEKLYWDSIRVLMKENGLTSFSQGQKKFEMLGEQTLGFLMHHCLIFAEMREDLKNIDIEILKTKVCLVQHIQVLADHFRLWQDKCSKLYPPITSRTHKSTAAEGYKPVRGSLAPAESALALARRSPYELEFCVYCRGAGDENFCCDGCPATYCPPSNRSNKSCLIILRKKGIHDSDSPELINSQGRLLHNLWLCPLCCQSLQLFQAVEDNDFGKVLEMTDRLQGNFLWRYRLFSGYTALHVAAAQNNCQMIELLLQPIRKGIIEGLISEKADVSKWKDANDDYWWKMPIRCLPLLHGLNSNPFEMAETHKAVEARLALGACYRGAPPPPRPRRPRGTLYSRSDRIWRSGGAGRGALRRHWASLRAAAAPLELGRRGAPLPLNGTTPAAERAAAAAAARGAARGGGGGGAGAGAGEEEEEEREYALFGEDATGGRAPVPVPWVNELDDERPDGFVYLLHSVQREGVGPNWNLAPDPCTDRMPSRRCGGGGSIALLEEEGPPIVEVSGARKGKKRPRPTTPPPGPAPAGAEGGGESPPPPPPGGCALAECRRARGELADPGGCHRPRGALRGVVECNYRCPCGPARNPAVRRAPAFAGRREAAPCGNRELLGLANGGLNPALRLLVFKTRRKGWGLRTLEDIPKGTFVCAYAGEVVAASEGLARERRYHAEGRPVYIMNLHGTLGKEGGQFYMVDSTEYRNIGALANHTCGPAALEWRKVWGDHLDPRLPAVGLYAARDVQAGEELEFKYDSCGRNKPDPCYCNHCGWDYH